jgi:rRNA maturation endonuclease Nob1
MIFMWLVFIGFIALTVLGVVWLVRAVGGGANPVTPGHTCSSCGRSVQTDWHNCPYCGAQLVK